MVNERGMDFLRECCRCDNLQQPLEEYIRSCRPPHRRTAEENETKSRTARLEKGRFPNLAGFCRYQHIGLAELTALAEEFPHAVAMLYAAMEDEALNAELPPALLSAYMKKRLGYDRTEERESEGSPLCVRFEHDIDEDGQ